jgi:hypothetical protein
MTGTSGRSALAFGKRSRPLIPGMLMSERIKMRYSSRISDALERRWGRLGKLHREPATAQVAPELLAEQHFDVRLIVNYENEQAHATPPDLLAGVATRGRTILNSVNSPG